MVNQSIPKNPRLPSNVQKKYFVQSDQSKDLKLSSRKSLAESNPVENGCSSTNEITETRQNSFNKKHGASSSSYASTHVIQSDSKDAIFRVIANEPLFEKQHHRDELLRSEKSNKFSVMKRFNKNQKETSFSCYLE